MLISVALPVYNGNPLLREALASVLTQDVELEVIVSDDGSRDGSIETVEAFADSRITILRNESNAGIFGNLNRCIAVARGELIQVFSQDDIMLPGYLASQAALLTKHPRAGLVYGAARAIDAEGNLVGEGGEDRTPEVIDNRLYVWIAAHYGALPASISSIMVRRRTFDAVGLFDETFRVAGDVEFYNRVSERFAILRNAEIRHAVRTHAGMATVHSASGPRYLAEELRLEPWFRKHFATNDWPKVRRFRSAVRGTYHLAWIKRRLLAGRFRDAFEGATQLNHLYPIHQIIGAHLQRQLNPTREPFPSVAPPQQR